MIDFNHIIHRSAEEVELVKGEMSTVLNFYSSRLSALVTWSEELRNERENPELAGLLVMVLNEKDTIDVVLQHLNNLFAPYLSEDATLPEDDGIFLVRDETDVEEMEFDECGDDGYGDGDGDGDGGSELEEESMLDILVSVLNEEYGSDCELSDEEKSDEDEI